MSQESFVQDMIDAVNNCCLLMRRDATLVKNPVVAERMEDIAKLEQKQDECEENLRRAQDYVQQWQRNLAEVCTRRGHG
jgi:hypothetical protein